MDTAIVTRLKGFPAIEDDAARILILGSMPSGASLDAGQYYAHPRNAFWKIIGELLELSEGATYAQRCAALRSAGIALWDVLEFCERPTSLDSDIAPDTMVVNDFEAFFTSHPNIRAVFFNGAKAEDVFRKRVRPTLSGVHTDLPCARLPSTSPAHASMRFDTKLAHWRRILA